MMVMFYKGLMVMLMVIVENTRGQHTSFNCKQAGTDYITPNEVEDTLCVPQFSINILHRVPDRAALTRRVHHSYTTLHVKVVRLSTINITWNAFVENEDGVFGPESCRLTSTHYLMQLDILCIFKNTDIVTHNFRSIRHDITLVSKCPWYDVGEGQELILSSLSGLKEDVNYLGSRDRFTHMLIDLALKANKPILTEIADSCAAEDAQIPSDVDNDDIHTCPRRSGNACNDAGTITLPSMMHTVLVFLIHLLL